MDDFFGAPAGKIGDLSTGKLTNDFATISNQSLDPVNDRIEPRQLQRGTLRGVLGVGGDAVSIDSDNRRIEVVAEDQSSITLGQVPDTDSEFGLATYTPDGDLLYKLNGDTWQWNDLSNDLPRMLLSATSSSFSFKIAKAGFDVRTATNDQLVFNSDQNVFKIIDKVNLTVPVNNPPATYNYYSDFVPHGLDFTPAYIAFVDQGTGRSSLPSFELSSFTSGGVTFLSPGTVKNAIVDATNVTATVECVAPNTTTYNFVIYLLQETATVDS